MLEERGVPIPAGEDEIEVEGKRDGDGRGQATARFARFRRCITFERVAMALGMCSGLPTEGFRGSGDQA